MKKDYLGKVLSFLTILMFIGVIASVMTQIITRYLPVSYPWTEELSRMMFVAAICFAAPVAYRDYEFVIVDLFIGKFPKKMKENVEFLICVSIVILFVVVFKYGLALTINGYRQMSSTLGITMAIPYAMIPISALGFIYYALINGSKIIRHKILSHQREGQ